jgi:hypothetical protein
MSQRFDDSKAQRFMERGRSGFMLPSSIKTLFSVKLSLPVVAGKMFYVNLSPAGASMKNIRYFPKDMQIRMDGTKIENEIMELLNYFVYLQRK